MIKKEKISPSGRKNKEIPQIKSDKLKHEKKRIISRTSLPLKKLKDKISPNQNKLALARLINKGTTTINWNDTSVNIHIDTESNYLLREGIRNEIKNKRLKIEVSPTNKTILSISYLHKNKWFTVNINPKFPPQSIRIFHGEKNELGIEVKGNKNNQKETFLLSPKGFNLKKLLTYKYNPQSSFKISYAEKPPKGCKPPKNLSELIKLFDSDYSGTKVNFKTENQACEYIRSFYWSLFMAKMLQLPFKGKKLSIMESKVKFIPKHGFYVEFWINYENRIIPFKFQLSKHTAPSYGAEPKWDVARVQDYKEFRELSQRTNISKMLREAHIRSINKRTIEKNDPPQGSVVCSIGINKYQSDIPLNGAKNDSQVMGQLLKAKYKSPHLVTNKKETLTKKEYIKLLKKAVELAKKQKGLILYLAGHAHKVPALVNSSGEMISGHKLFISASDSKLSGQKLFGNMINPVYQKNTFISSDELYKIISPLLNSGKKVTIILDQCHAELFAKYFKHRNLTVIGSAGAEEKAMEISGKKKGKFTHYLSKHLKKPGNTLGKAFLNAEEEMYINLDKSEMMKKGKKIYETYDSQEASFHQNKKLSQKSTKKQRKHYT